MTRRPTLVLGTYNPGGDLTATELGRDLAELARICDAFALNEFTNRGPRLVELCQRNPWLGLYAGDGTPGASATPVLWDTRRWDLDLATTTPLIPATRLPQPSNGKDPAGPARVKRKPFNAVRLVSADGLEVGGELVTFRFGSIHAPASHWWPPRRRLARDQMLALDEYADAHRGVDLFVAGDYNTKPKGPAREPLRSGGWVSAQQSRPGGPIVTHPKTGGRIDDVEHHRAKPTGSGRDYRWQPISVRTLPSAGDHRRLITGWRLTRTA